MKVLISFASIILGLSVVFLGCTPPPPPSQGTDTLYITRTDTLFLTETDTLLVEFCPQDSVPPPADEPPPSSSACRHPAFPGVEDEKCVTLDGKVYSTRFPEKTVDTPGNGYSIGQRNHTVTLTGIESEDSGFVEWEARYDAQLVDPSMWDFGGGKHYHQVQTYPLDRSYAVRSGKSLRVELDEIATNPRVVVHCYDNEELVAQPKSRLGFDVVNPDRWYKWRLAWQHNPVDGTLFVSVTLGEAETMLSFQIPKDFPGPGRYFSPLGHVETRNDSREESGMVHIRGLRFSE